MFVSIMALESFRPQGYAPIRLKKEEVSEFFTRLRERKLVRGGEGHSFKITNKPLVDQKGSGSGEADIGISKATTATSRKRKGGCKRGPPKKRAKKGGVTKKRSRTSSKKAGRKGRKSGKVKLEKHIAKAKL